MAERRVIDTLTPWERIQAGMPTPDDLLAVLALRDEATALRARVAELEAQVGIRCPDCEEYKDKWLAAEAKLTEYRKAINP